MDGKIIPFRNPASAIARFIRVGEAHKKFGELHAAGRLPVRRVVIEARASVNTGNLKEKR